MIDLPTAHRFLNALTVLETSPRFPRYAAFARQCQRDMASPGVSVLDYIEPIASRPVEQLSAEEQLWRAVAQDISRHTVKETP